MKQIEIHKNIENFNKERTAIDNEIKQIGSNKPTPTSEVMVKISSKIQTKCDLELSYFVNNAGWFPSYDIRAKSIDGPIELIYKANIHQNTKEDWKNVKLKLSSSNPNLGSVAPQLQTYFLNYNTIAPRYTNLNNQVTGKITDAATNEPLPGTNIIIKGSTIGTISDMDGNYSLSVPNNNCELSVSFIGYQSQTLVANKPVLNVSLEPDIKQLDEVVVAGYGAQKKMFKSEINSSLKGKVPGLSIRGASSLLVPVAQTENQTSFEFEIKTPYSVYSDNKNLTVDMDDYNLDADYEYYCVPKIDKDAFLIANIVNWEKYNLLEGEANIFFENTFVGKTILDVRYISDTLKLSLGRDKNVLIKREKMKDYTTKQFLGSKKEETRAWQLSIKNNKKQPITLNLYDQAPVSTNEEIEVQIDQISGGSINKEKGEIKWNIKLEPSAKKDLELIYKVKYPKDKKLTIE
jgi:hypothetical protein